VNSSQGFNKLAFVVVVYGTPCDSICVVASGCLLCYVSNIPIQYTKHRCHITFLLKITISCSLAATNASITSWPTSVDLKSAWFIVVF